MGGARTSETATQLKPSVQQGRVGMAEPPLPAHWAPSFAHWGGGGAGGSGGGVPSVQCEKVCPTGGRLRNVPIHGAARLSQRARHGAWAQWRDHPLLWTRFGQERALTSSTAVQVHPESQHSIGSIGWLPLPAHWLPLAAHFGWSTHLE